LALRGVELDVKPGEIIALVGESGCGKSITAQAIMRLIPTPPGKILDGEVLFQGKDLIKAAEFELEKIRGRDISIIFQDPTAHLNPTLTVESQICEVLVLHRKLTWRQAGAAAAELLDMVGLPHDKQNLKSYPHQLSGGMRQKVMIAMAFACQPKLLIADEPTTALDVTVQAQIMDLIKKLSAELKASVIFITHDFGLVAALAQRIFVMYAGQVIESGPVERIFYNPCHPYTRGLLNSLPGLGEKKKRIPSISGQPPDLSHSFSGCAFLPRCKYGMKICSTISPEAITIEKNHSVMCWLEHIQCPVGSRTWIK